MEAASAMSTKQLSMNALDAGKPANEVHSSWTHIKYLIMTNKQQAPVLESQRSFNCFRFVGELGMNKNRDERLEALEPATAINKNLKHIRLYRHGIISCIFK